MKWSRSWKLNLGVMLAGLIINRISRLKEILTAHPTVYNDSNCVLKGDMKGAEDMALGKEGKLFMASSGGLKCCFSHGSESCESGGVYVLDLMESHESTPKLLEIHGYPHKSLHAHGIYLSNQTDRLYMINHLGDETTVEVLQVEYQPILQLTHLNTVRSPLFSRYSINDIIEGKNSSEIYTTQWLVFPFPQQGRENPSTWREWLEQRVLVPAILLTGIPLTAVYRCDITADLCEVASDRLFVSANGITTTPDRNTMFVSDWTDKRVALLKRQENGWLALDTWIQLPVSVDNLEFESSSGEVLAGTMPDLWTVMRSTHGEDVPVPGGLSVIYLEDGIWKNRAILYHDGTKLSQISAANRFSNVVFLSSPWSPGILQCTI